MTSIFTKIINREIPSKIFFESDEVIVIQDINPKEKVHLLIIPKADTKDFFNTPAATLSMLNGTAKRVAEKLGLADHFKIVINNGFGQEIDHVHYHFLSNRDIGQIEFIN